MAAGVGPDTICYLLYPTPEGGRALIVQGDNPTRPAAGGGAEESHDP